VGFTPLSHPFCPLIEVLFRVYNWKLRAVLRNAGVQTSECKNQIIKGTSQIVANLSYKNSDPHFKKGFGGWAKPDWVRGIRIELDDNSIRLLPQNLNEE